MTYTKEIDGKQVFSTCRTITLADGAVVSNPTEEMILANGWTPYTPHVEETEPEPKTAPDDYEKIQAISKLLATTVMALDDEAALEVIALFPAWGDFIGKELHTGERYYYNDKLFKVLLDHTAQAEWTPEISPSLFVEVTVEEFPEWKQPVGSADAYSKGDKVAYNGEHYVSIADGNVWEPGVYGWDKI